MNYKYTYSYINKCIDIEYIIPNDYDINVNNYFKYIYNPETNLPYSLLPCKEITFYISKLLNDIIINDKDIQKIKKINLKLDISNIKHEDINIIFEYSKEHKYNYKIKNINIYDKDNNGKFTDIYISEYCHYDFVKLGLIPAFITINNINAKSIKSNTFTEIYINKDNCNIDNIIIENNCRDFAIKCLEELRTYYKELNNYKQQLK